MVIFHSYVNLPEGMNHDKSIFLMPILDHFGTFMIANIQAPLMKQIYIYIFKPINIETFKPIYSNQYHWSHFLSQLIWQKPFHCPISIRHLQSRSQATNRSSFGSPTKRWRWDVLLRFLWDFLGGFPFFFWFFGSRWLFFLVGLLVFFVFPRWFFWVVLVLQG